MKNKLILFSLFSTIHIHCDSQNLVPNPSFELNGNIVCGIYWGSNFTSSVTNWYDAGGTPDLFSIQLDDSCWNAQPVSQYAGPIGLKGSQLPRTGNIFAGEFFYTIDGFNQREYIGCQLSSPLIIGRKYCVEFYVSAADNHEKFVNRFGVYFSSSAIITGTDQVIAVTPQIDVNGFISDTSNWVLVSGNFTATNADSYITIGNFYNDAATSFQFNPDNTGQPGTYGAYYFIDDVSVINCNVGIDDNHELADIGIYPNPVADQLTINLNEQKEVTLSIINITGEIVLSKHLTGQTELLDLSFLSSGMYIVQLTNAMGSYQKKIIKE